MVTLGGRSISNEICFIDTAKEIVGLFILLRFVMIFGACFDTWLSQRKKGASICRLLCEKCPVTSIWEIVIALRVARH